MKSHLAYSFMLGNALGVAEPGKPKNILLISMRDDFDAARITLTRLIEQQGFAEGSRNPADVLSDLLKWDRLEILYNWPGCVTPNEFFHRIYVALARKRGSADPGETLSPKRDTAEIVVLNGLDQLDVKFPLCGNERVFVPALISLFRCFKVCSVVITTEDRSGSSQDTRPLSDLILEFSVTSVPEREFLPYGTTQSSRVSMVRVPAGQIGGRYGILGRNALGRMDMHLPPSLMPD
jgi:hypothetical protein